MPASPRLRILITAGPTREHFDSVRFITNASSGKMGYALAEAACRRGHRVVLVSGPVALKPPRGVRTIHVVTAQEMCAAAKRAFRDCDAAIFTAAVCDYRPAIRHRRKVPKSAAARRVRLLPTEDISAALGRVKGHRITIAFAMEDHAGRRHAEAKLRRKNCDAIILNGPENVGADRARVEFLAAGGQWARWPTQKKSVIARQIILRLERQRRNGVNALA